MDNNSANSSLLGFLQKKSLFSNSPSSRNRNRSRSGSKEGRFAGSRSNVYQLEDRHEQPTSGKFTYQEDNLRHYEMARLPQEEPPSYFRNPQPTDNRGRLEPSPHDPRPYQSTFPLQDTRADERAYHSNLPRADQRAEQRGFNLPSSPSLSADYRLLQQPEERFFKTSEVQANRYEGERSTASRPLEGSPYDNQLWAGLVAHTHTFESARLESIQCLESLSGRLSNEISSINFKIDSFNTAMGKALSNEFRSMREKILQLVEQVFRESDRFIRDYMRQQEGRLAGEMAKVRDTLLKEQAKVEVMKEELKKPAWRKTAGEILTTELEKRVEELVRSSAQMEVGHWQLGDLGGGHIQKIEAELRELVRLKPPK
jgi:hypothetical protein